MSCDPALLSAFGFKYSPLKKVKLFKLEKVEEPSGQALVRNLTFQVRISILCPIQFTQINLCFSASCACPSAAADAPPPAHCPTSSVTSRGSTRRPWRCTWRLPSSAPITEGIRTDRRSLTGENGLMKKKRKRHSRNLQQHKYIWVGCFYSAV